MLSSIAFLKSKLEENEKIVVTVQEVGAIDIYPWNRVNIHDSGILRIFKDYTEIIIPANRIILIQKSRTFE